MRALERASKGQPAFMSSWACLKTQSLSRHSPYLIRFRHSGILAVSNSCRKPQSSPFMHRPLSQYVHTVCKRARVCQSLSAGSL